jgi:hypothetical protein
MYQTRSILLYERENLIQEETVRMFSHHVACFLSLSLSLKDMDKKRLEQLKTGNN